MESVKKLPNKRHIKPTAKRIFLRLMAGSTVVAAFDGVGVFLVVLLLAFFVLVAAICNCKISLYNYKVECGKSNLNS